MRPKPAAIRLFIRVVSGADFGARAALGEVPTLVGRLPSSGLVLSDPKVSRRHLTLTVDGLGVVARIETRGQRFLLRGESATEERLAPGEDLRIGDTVLRVGTVVEAEAGMPESEAARSLLQSKATLAGPALASLVELSTLLRSATTENDFLHAVFAWCRGQRLAERASLEIAPGGPTGAVEDDALLPCRVQMQRANRTYWLPLDRESSEWLVLEPFSSAPAPDAALGALFTVVAELAGAALEHSRRARGLRAARSDDRLPNGVDAFVGKSVSSQEILARVTQYAASSSNLLLLGPSGVGKSLVARLVHQHGARAHEPFLEINCAALPPALLEAELFGYERGAFTGAVEARTGILADAGAGTLFLDEIGDMPLDAQAKLLGVLDRRTFHCIGSRRTQLFRARVIAATNRPLSKLVTTGQFREDLYYRLSVLKLALPPLRERPDDLPELIDYWLLVATRNAYRNPMRLTKAARAQLLDHDWPGNVRELRSVLERAVATSSGPLVDTAALEIGAAPSSRPSSRSGIRLPTNAAELEERNFAAAHRKHGGDAGLMAEALGVSRMTVYRWLERRIGRKEE